MRKKYVEKIAELEGRILFLENRTFLLEWCLSHGKPFDATVREDFEAVLAGGWELRGVPDYYKKQHERAKKKRG